MKPGSPPVASLAIALALSLAAPARAIPPAFQAPEPGRAPGDPAEAAPAPERAAPSDCSFAGTADPDGRRRREAVSKATVVFQASHTPSPNGGASALPDVPVKGVQPIKSGPIPRVNFIDDEIFGAMAAANVTPAPLAGDAEFLRRVTLDLAGRIPTMAEVQSFVADTAADKRSKKIDALLASEDFVDRWAFWLDEQHRNTANADSGQLFAQGRNAYHAWFLDALRSRKPYDQLVRELISSTGSNVAIGSNNWMVRQVQNNGPAQDTYDNMAADVAAKFLGAGAMFCTSCHNGAGHLDLINLWGSGIRRQNHWEMSAFFAKIRLPRSGTSGADYYFTVVDDPTLPDYRLNTTTGNKTTRDGTWTTPAGLTNVRPKYLFGGQSPTSSYRQNLASYVTSDPQFARAAANYFWKELFVVGLVEPADNWDFARLDPANPPPAPWTLQPTHPNLVVRLGQKFQELGYDIRGLLKFLTESSAYQLSATYAGTWSEAYTPYFARHFVQRLAGEMLFDAITSATAVPIPMQPASYPAPVLKALQLPDASEPRGNANARSFLDAFLRGDRDQDPRSYQASITQALNAMNNTTVVTNRIKATTAGSTINALQRANAANDTIVDTLWLSTLSRAATAEERASALARLAAPPQGQTKWNVAEDLQWALVNKLDFILKY